MSEVDDAQGQEVEIPGRVEIKAVLWEIAANPTIDAATRVAALDVLERATSHNPSMLTRVRREQR